MRRKVQLYIAGRQVDLGDDSFILYNWTREDLSNPTAVVNSSSQQVGLPGTCRNNSLFGSVFRLDRRTLFGIRYDGADFDPTRKTPFILYDNNGRVLESGYCRLDAVNTHSRRHAYTVTLYGGLGSYFYALSSKEDGTPRTLADLIYADMNGNDVTAFPVFPGADSVQDAWTVLGGGTPELKTFWNVINFAPAYNGLPDDFDASHALMNNDAYVNMPIGVDEDGERGYEYTYKAGLDCALVSFSNPHTEWELCDLRWYLQRPVISVKAFIAAVCDSRNNGGYDVELDATFFNDDNPAYAAAWWTLHMIASEDRAHDDCIENVLKATKTPMDYLVGYCKHFGLLFVWDSERHTVRILTRASFYQQEFIEDAPDVEPAEDVEGSLATVPSSYDTVNSSYYSLSNIANAYKGAAGSTYATCSLTRGAGAETHLYLKFDFSDIPRDAIITSVAVKAKATITNTTASNISSRRIEVCAGTTAKGGSSQVTSTQTVLTLDAGSEWTRDELDTLAVHIYAIRANGNVTSNYALRAYGADVTVEYTVPAPPPPPRPVTTIPVIDLTKRIDRGQEIRQDPVLADKRWYQLGDVGKGEFVEKYAQDYGRGYGTQRIDTGYEFDAGTKVLTEGNVFQEAAEVQESDVLFGEASRILSGREWQRYFQLPRFEGVTYELWNEAGESKSFPMQCPQDTTYWDMPGTPGADWLPKVQLHGAENKANDGANVLLFFVGIKDTPVYSSGSWNVRKSYFLTDDNGTMTDLAGAPCWDLTRTGIQRLSLPSFRRVYLSGRYILDSWEWGVPAVRPVLNIDYPSGKPTTLFAKWWQAYLRDRYNVDTRVMTARVDLRGLPVGQELLRRFYWYDNAVWVLNAIRNHPLTSYDLTECEFVRVQDKRAYTLGPGAALTQYLMIEPDASSFSLNPSGETLPLTVKSSSAWTLSLSTIVSWLTVSATSGSAGTTSITFTGTANTSGGRRQVTVTLTNTEGETLSFVIRQAMKVASSLSISPSSIVIPASGTAEEGVASRGRSCRVTADGAWDVDWDNVPSWLTVIKSTVGITLKAGANAGEERSASIKIFLTGEPETYATLSVVQEAGEGGTGGITLLDGNGNNSTTVESDGGTVTLVLTIPDGADWTIASSASWASVTPVSGSGNNNQIAVTVPAYTGSSDRPATITATRSGYAEGAVFYLYQAAPSSQDSIALYRADAHFFDNVEIDGNSSIYPVDVVAVGAWTVASGSSWIHPYTNYGAWSGSGNATLWFQVDANLGAPRTGTIVGTHTATGQTATFYVYQSGDGTVSLDASFSSQSIDSSAQQISLSIRATSGLAWTIDSISSGLSLDATSGTGPATIVAHITAASAQRTLSCRVRNTAYGLSVTPSCVQQAPAASDYLRVTPFGTFNVGAAQTSQVFRIECSTAWRVTSASSEVSISPASGSGNANVTVTFPANKTTSAKDYALTFATTSGTSISVNATIHQLPASSATLEVSPTAVTIPGTGAAETVTITASGTWTATKSDSWITTAVPNAGTLRIGASVNSGAPRDGTVTITCGDKSVTVAVHQATTSALEVSANAVQLAAASGSQGTVTVYASGLWDISEYTDIPIWLDVVYPAHAGSDNGETMTFRAKTANTTGSNRTATIRVVLADNTEFYEDITVTQLSSSVLYCSPTGINVPAEINTGFVHITSNTSWHLQSLDEGLSIASAAQSGTGDADVMFLCQANPDEQVRQLRGTFVTDDGTKTASFTVIQEAAQAAIVIDPDSALWFETSDDPEASVLTQVRKITTTKAWTAVSSKSWLTFSPASGAAGETTVTFTARGSLTDVLSATWTITAGDATKTLGARCIPAPTEDPNTY